MSLKIALKSPRRNLKTALKYWKPTRLTLKTNPKIMAWFWWNYTFEEEETNV
jgi:hypothetical protein